MHTAAASNLGQMLLRLCQADDVPLVNIVRSPEQVALLQSMGAEWVLNSQDDSFMKQLIEALVPRAQRLPSMRLAVGEVSIVF